MLVPVADARNVDNYPFPNLGLDGMPIGGFTLINVTILQWQSVQFAKEWSFEFRPAGTHQPWEQPPLVVENARAGMEAAIIPRREGVLEYEFMPLPFDG